MINTKLIVVFALLLGGICGYLIAQEYRVGEKDHRSTELPAGVHRMPDGSMMDNGTNNSDIQAMNGMDHGIMMVSSEKEFLTLMIPHHQEAVDTAKVVLARGATTPEIKTLVEHIITAQEKEIADMKTWYQAWYGTPYTPSGTYQPMMRDLTQLSGIALDKAFLEDMIMHHMGALMMAHSVQAVLKHEEIANLAKAINDTQTEEIELMRQLRAELK